MDNPTKIRFENGLSVLLKEIHSAPIISLWTWYRVGSRYEKPGLTGISHWVEHMQFKGTEKYPSNAMDRLIAREGGVWNAFTHVDWTTYFETMPANKIDLAMDLEADRMVNSLFNPIDVESERTVIISEKEGKDNEPFLRLSNAVNEAAFLSHPYRNEVIGSLEDLQRIQRDDLYHHYRKYYQPANAIISMAGDFNTSEMIEKIQNQFMHISSEFLPDPKIQPEHEIQKKNEILLSGPGDTIFIQIAYRSPSASDPDFFSFTILDSLLSGPASLNMFGGGGTSNRTSRLYKKIVDKQLAVSLAGGLQATVDPHLYDLSITLHQGQDPEIVIKTIDQEIERLIEKRIRNSEIQRAVKQAKAMFAYGLENITNQAFWLGYSESFANYDWYSSYLDRLNEIKPRDVQRVAEKYLHPEKRVIGIYHPDFSESKQS
jgi:zinc protease